MKLTSIVLLAQLFYATLAFSIRSLNAAAPVAQRQVTRAQLEARAKYRDLLHRMGRRDAVPTFVCPPQAVITPIFGNGPAGGCCPTGQTYAQSDGICCPAGQAYGCVGQSCCTETVDSSGDACCPADEIDEQTGLCLPTPQPVPVGQEKRAMKERMIKRDGHRTLLDAELTAQYLLKEGEFEHEGVTYVDQDHRDANQDAWLKTFRSGSIKLLNMASHSSKLSFMFPKMYLREEQALSNQYKFRVADALDIMEHLKKDFKPFEWRGIQFDKTTLLSLVKHAPNFNATTFADWE